MATFDFDLFVMGAGSGGVRAARMAAQYGARVAAAEEHYLGGTCVNVGCVPKKLFVYASHFSEEVGQAPGFGWEGMHPGFSWPTLRDNKDKEIARLNGVYRNLLENASVTLFDERARIVDPHTIAIADRTVTTERILVATGSWPCVPEFPGRDYVITSNEAFHLEQFPKRTIVVGGGYIAAEFAGIFKGLGADSRLLYRGPLFLRKFDQDVRAFVADELRKKGIHLHFNSVVKRVTRTAEGDLSVETTTGETLRADLVMCATGRNPAIADIGLENVNVETRANGAIVVDDEFRTSEPSIFALGDVIDRVQLTPVAIAEAMAFARTQFLEDPVHVDYEAIPTAVFCQPNIGAVGLTEEEARERHREIEIYLTSFRPMKHTLSGSDEQTMMKIIVDKPSDRVVGVHMVGPEAGEIIQGMSVAMKAGATKAIFDSTIGIHPTTAEEFVTMRAPVR